MCAYAVIQSGNLAKNSRRLNNAFSNPMLICIYYSIKKKSKHLFDIIR